MAFIKNEIWSLPWLIVNVLQLFFLFFRKEGMPETFTEELLMLKTVPFHPVWLTKWLLPLFAVNICFLFGSGILARLSGGRKEISRWAMLIGMVFWAPVNRPGAYLLWNAGGSRESMVLYVLFPVLLYLILTMQKKTGLIAVFICGGACMCMAPKGFFKAMQGDGTYYLAQLLFLLLWFLFFADKKCRSLIETKKNIPVCLGVTALAMLLSLTFRMSILSNSFYAPIDNKYRMDAALMQMRQALEEYPDDVTVLAPVRASGQLNDVDRKAFQPLGPMLVSVNAGLVAPEGLTPEQFRDYEVASELIATDFADEKMIQHGLGYGIEILIAPGRSDAGRDDLYASYGYVKKAENAEYTMYAYLGEGAFEWTLTQFPTSREGFQAMCYTLTDAEGHLILIDGGYEMDGANLGKYLDSLGGHVDAWILTHPHPDHIGAFNQIYANTDIVIDRIYAAPVDHDLYEQYADWWDEFNIYEDFVSLTENADNLTYLSEGDTVDLFGLTMDVLHSFDAQELKAVGSEDPCNDGGLLFKISGREKSVLFMADVGACMTDEILRDHADEMDADFVQVGHHGNGGLAWEAYDVITPELAFFDMPVELLEERPVAAGLKEHLESMGVSVVMYDTAPNAVSIY